ncbi:hypothetical protein RD055328_10890 [Companilactobacillus sp. RD055328]|uniref:hypothetical protein n=1 Tax=Companilactobacillus sp. RD055328 TaxID=2916634 RepID=UPI001FC81010|nr:hypothetical protein [Companilactobacillus sp. RD055328]GKQ43166.1 hypothetical protein RD055328_10890 [Companilactobacillus sp. RD055328]
MAYRTIKSVRNFQPIGSINNYENGLFIDSQNNILEQRGTEYIKVGYRDETISAFVKMIPSIGIGVVLLNLFSPKGAKTNNTMVNIVLWVIGFFIAIFLAVEVILGWICEKIIFIKKDLVIQMLNNQKWTRLFAPTSWYRNNGGKISGYLHLAIFALIPILLVECMTLYFIQNSTMDEIIMWTLVMTGISIICMIYNIIINIASKVVSK